MHLCEAVVEHDVMLVECVRGVELGRGASVMVMLGSSVSEGGAPGPCDSLSTLVH